MNPNPTPNPNPIYKKFSRRIRFPKLYDENNLNTPFIVTYTGGRSIHSVNNRERKQTDVWVTSFVDLTSLDTMRCKKVKPILR